MRIKTAGQFIAAIRADHERWEETRYPWFRGEPLSSQPLLPRLYRRRPHGKPYRQSENALLQMFRMKAASFSDRPVPDRKNTDQWLFLAQHVGVPTRLLDWTESALVALWFAILEKRPVVWMLNPLALNRLSGSEQEGKRMPETDQFPLTWYGPPGKINIGHESVCAAWENRPSRIDLPVAVIPTYIHTRMSAQRSCFTIHDRREHPLCDLVPMTILKRYVIEPSAVGAISKELNMLGVLRSTAFPDLDGLAGELRSLY